MFSSHHENHRVRFRFCVCPKLSLTPRFQVLEAFVPAVFPVPAQAAEHSQWLMQSATANAEVLYSVLALSTASYLRVMRSLGIPSPQLTAIESWSRKACLQANAVRELRQRVARVQASDVDPLLYAVLCLLVTEVAFGIHRKGIHDSDMHEANQRKQNGGHSTRQWS